MILLWLAIEVCLSVAAGILVAGGLVMLSWWVFGLARHPQAGPPLALVVLIIILHRQAGSNHFVQMLLLFSGLFTIGIRIVGGKRRDVPY